MEFRISEISPRILLVLFYGSILFSCTKTQEPYKVVYGILPGDIVNTIVIDQNGIKWFGTDKGLVSFNNEIWKTYTSVNVLADLHVYDLALQPSVYENGIWVATGKGVTACNYNVDGITDATTYNTDNSGIGDTVVTVSVDTGKVKWFGTNIGISIFFNQGVWQSISYATAGHKEVNCIGSAPDGWNYLGTKGTGVARYIFDEVDGISGASLYQQPWSPLPSQDVLSVFVEENGDQWYGTNEGIAYHQGTDAKKGWTLYSVKDGLANNVVLSVIKDQQNNMWFGTMEGVSFFDGNTWTTFTIHDGLAGTIVYALAEDVDGSIWLGTDHGLSHWQSEKKIIYRK